MGACMTRCWPLYPDPRYQPVRSRYLRQDETVQLELIDTEEAQPRRTFSLTSSLSSSDESVHARRPVPCSDPGEGGSPRLENDLPLCLSPLPASTALLPGPLQDSPPPRPPARSPSDHSLSSGAPPSTLLSTDSRSSTPLLQLDSPPHSPSLVGLSPCQRQFYRLTSQAEDEVELTPHLEQQDLNDTMANCDIKVVTTSVGGRRWGMRGDPGSLPSLTEPDSPPTTSLDLEWEPEAGLGVGSRESLGADREEEEASHTAESGSWVPRSSCSTPNSLEWDFRASTLSLRGGSEGEAWQHTDMETEQLLHEIEQLAARALADTGHGLQSAPR
ncbi:uncharacterized protein LOC122259969 isoform X2 [Penaeus japonicus]|uniref:uncharacterized protein LOC122259969 isoform X2 n=1 Tax=Penaeus japonicus TaxID=27405 RepID=UPI001C70F199|nr:uncharacterized protein LOC122259969 isoform X2 [Penaeus japonicus]